MKLTKLVFWLMLAGASTSCIREDLDACLEAAYARGVRALPKGRNWIELPDGLQIEGMAAPQSSMDWSFTAR